MSDWSKPTLTSNYSDFVAEVKGRDDDLAKQFDGTTSPNVPTGTIKWNSSNRRHEKWNGSAWSELVAKATTAYAIRVEIANDADRLGGQLPSYYTDIPSRLGYTPLSTGGGSVSGGLVIDGNTSNQASDATLYVTANGSNDWGVRVQKNQFDYGHLIEVGAAASYGLRILFGGAERFRIGDASQVISGNQILHAGNYSSYAAPASHSHNYLPLAGGTITGLLSAQAGVASNTGTGDPLRLVNPGGAGNWSGASLATGAIKIRLPVGMTNTMVRMTIKVYTYDNGSFEISCGGYNYPLGNTWINTFAYMLTQSRTALNVRFGFDGTYACIYIGEASSQWSYPNVFVTDVQGGYSNYTADQWATNWGVTFETSFANVTAVQTVYPQITSAGGTMSGNPEVANSSPRLNLRDTSDNTTRALNNDSGVIGFVNPSGGWSFYSTDAGGAWSASYGWLHDYFFNSVGNCAGQGTASPAINCYGSGNILGGYRHELIDNGGQVALRTVNYFTNCNCDCACGW